MKKFINLISIFLVLVMCLSIPLEAKAHNHTSYSHESNVGLTKNDWLSYLPDHLRLNELSIPGTFQSVSYGNGFTDYTLTQSMDLKTQLNSGIRYVDINLKKYDSDTFHSYFSGIPLSLYLDDILNIILNFLNDNPSEFVLLKISESGKNYDFFESLIDCIEFLGYEDSIYDASSVENPFLRDIRGKIVVLSDSTSSTSEKTIDVSNSNTFKRESILKTNWDLYPAWMELKNTLISANKNNGNNLYITHAVGHSSTVFPYFAASGHISSGTNSDRLLTGLTEPAFSGHYPDFPRVGRFFNLASIAFEGLNTLTYDLIRKSDFSHLGVVAFSFPGSGSIQQVLDINFKSSNLNKPVPDDFYDNYLEYKYDVKLKEN